MTHIMLDLETWGKHPGCDIRSIGAVVFDPVAGTVTFPLGGWKPGDIGGLFYVATENPGVDEIAGGKYQLTRDPETVQWWNDQTPEAQAAFANPVDLKDACKLFADWLGDQYERDAAYEPTDLRIWANDPHFDVSILDAVFRAVQLPTPWHYRSPRSMKTITEAAGMTSADYSNYGTAHNALDDAIAQAMTVCEAYKRLGLQK